MMINPLTQISGIADTTKLTKEANKSNQFQEVLEKAMTEKDDKKLKEACQEVEAYMLSSLFKQMKQSTEMGERLIPKSDYEEMFEEQLIDEQCKSMTKAGGIGLADSMYKQMTRLQVNKPEGK